LREFTLLPLESFRRILGYNPWHFWQLADNSIVPVTSSCNDILTKYPWQNTDACGRQDILEAIYTAERRLYDYLGYDVAPTFRETILPFPKYHDRGVWHLAQSDRQGRWLDVKLPYGYIDSIGLETRDLIEDHAVVAYTDEDGDGLDDTFTISAATTVTNEDLIVTYIAAADRLNNDSVSEEYRIRPTKVAISAGVVTITGAAWLLVKPILYEGTGQAEIDPTVAANFVSELEIYARYADPDGTTYDTSQAALIWETAPYPAFCCGCTGTGTNDTDPAAEAYAVARAGIRHTIEGIVNIGAAVYNTTTSAWEGIDWSVCRPPERVIVRYKAGYPLSGGEMDKRWQTAVTRFAAAELARPICACDNANRELYRWQFDVARTGGSNDESYQATTMEDLANPFGTRRGHLYAWKFVKSMRTLQGYTF
jgi:hypothetical protein